MPISLNGTNGITFPDSSLQAAAASPYVLKNRIINGDMRIDQRNAGASVTPTTVGLFIVDRWNFEGTQSSKMTLQQNLNFITPPAGHKYYYGATTISAYSVGATDYFKAQQIIEGYNMDDFGWGTANAQTVTLSFWVRSSLTGTFGGVLFNNTNDTAYPFAYTISSANTWEQKSVTIAGPTTGTWNTTNGAGIKVNFSLGAGSTYSGTAGTWANTLYISTTGATSVVGTNGATWYITGVQLEQGTSATPFERRLYGQELANCQRYYQNVKGALGVAGSSTLINWTAPLPVQMRTSPSIGKTATSFAWGDMVSTGFNSSGNATLEYLSNDIALSGFLTGFTGLTSYRTYRHEPAGSNNALFALSAEL
jgi:hypothetical protein